MNILRVKLMIEITRIKILKDGSGAYAVLPISQRVGTRTEADQFREYWQGIFNNLYKNCHIEIDCREKVEA